MAERDPTDRAGWTRRIDLGADAHRRPARRRCARRRAAGVAFVGHRHAQAAGRVTAARPVAPEPTAAGDVVRADATITLGRPTNRPGAVRPSRRLVTSRHAAGTEHRCVPDRHALTAAAVVARCRQRWPIERFCRWLEAQIMARHPFGASREAVWRTGLSGAVVALLAAADAPDLAPLDPSETFLRQGWA